MTALTPEKVVQQAKRLKVFPAAAMQVHSIVANPRSSLSDLEQCVSSDATLSAQLLRLSNSAFYGAGRQVSTLRQALFVLGFDATRTTALALALASIGQRERPMRRALWQHSLRCGLVAQSLARRHADLDWNEAFVTGILHDLGKSLMLETDEANYLPLLQNPQRTETECIEQERQLWGYSHAHLGGYCLEQWDLPMSICHAVRWHHTWPIPAHLSQTTIKLTTVLRVANLLEHELSLQKDIESVQSAVTDSPEARALSPAQIDVAVIASDLIRDQKVFDL